MVSMLFFLKQWNVLASNTAYYNKYGKWASRSSMSEIEAFSPHAAI